MALLKLTVSDIIDHKQGPKGSNYKKGILEAAANSEIVIFVGRKNTIVLKSPDPKY